MSTDSSKPTEAHNPIDVAVEGLVLRPEVFNTPGPGAGDDGKINIALAHAAAAREKADLPVVKSHILPLWALLPIVAVGIAAGSYLGPNFGSGPNIKGYDYSLTYPEGEAGGGIELDENDPKVWLAKGKGEYATVCASCHQASGEGIAGQYPPLKGSEWVIHGEERLVAILLHGIAGPLHVNGKAYTGTMPAQGALKNDKAIAQLASYVRNEWGNQASIIYDDTVKELRKKYSGQAAPFSEAELLKIPQDANGPPSKKAGGGVPAADPAAAAATATPAPAPAPPAPAAQ